MRIVIYNRTKALIALFIFLLAFSIFGTDFILFQVDPRLDARG